MNSFMLKHYYDKIPEYYDTMYLDGYSPEEILSAVQKKMNRKPPEQEQEPQLEKIIEQKLDEAIENALNNILKGFK